MDMVTAAFLRDFSNEYEIAGYAEDKQFEVMSAYLTVRRNYSETFDPLTLIVGSGGDLGIDAIAIIVNGTLIDEMDTLDEILNSSVDYLDVTFVFVQAERSSSFDGSKLGTFAYGVQEFFNLATTEPRNGAIVERMNMMEKIFDKGSKFKRKNPTCILYYVTTGTWPKEGSLPSRRERFIQELMEMHVFGQVEITPIGAAELAALFRESKHSISREFNFVDRTEVPEIAGVSEAFVGFIPATEFLSIVRDEEGGLVKSIFYDNVRDWQDYMT